MSQYENLIGWAVLQKETVRNFKMRNAYRYYASTLDGIIITREKPEVLFLSLKEYLTKGLTLIMRQKIFKKEIESFTILIEACLNARALQELDTIVEKSLLIIEKKVQ